MDNNVIKDERERRIEEQRKQLLEETEKKEKQQKARIEKKKKASLFFQLKTLFTPKQKLTDVSALNLTDFPEPEKKETLAQAAVQQSCIALDEESLIPRGAKEKKKENKESSAEDNEKANEPADNKKSGLQNALDTISGRYAIIAFTCLDDEVKTEDLLKTGLTVLSTGIYPMPYKKEEGDTANIFIAILNDCWQNKNALNKLTEDLSDEFLKETGKELLTVCLGATEDDVNGQLKRTVNALHRKIRNLTTPDTTGDLSALQHRLKQQIEANAIEQARRQFERQMEEDGEIDEELPVVIREAKNMSSEEYDSYLSEEEQAIKYNARKSYIDDDVSIEQVIHNIEKHNTMDDPLYLIAVASVDMNTLIILEDSDDFEDLCEEADVSMMRCSYIYAISKSGGHWYGNNHATRDIEDIFESLSEIIRSRGGRFRSEFLYEVPNISIFKDIYLQ